jgi:hypothetical protein
MFDGYRDSMEIVLVAEEWEDIGKIWNRMSDVGECGVVCA